MALLPPYEDWKAPWETKGEDFDAERAKKFVYNLERDKERLVGERSAVVTERDQFKAKVTEFETKDLSDNQRLTRELEELKKAPKETVNKMEIILDRGADKGLTVPQIKAASRWISGETAEEIEKAFDAYVTDHSLGGENGGGAGKAGAQTQPVRKTQTVTGVAEVDENLDDEGHYKDPGAALEAFRASL